MSDVIVNAGCMLFFSKGVAAQLKKDVLDSTLFTQLAADKKYSRFSATKEWKERHLSAMTHFGWVMNAAETLNQPVPCCGPLKLWAWLNEVLPQFMPTDAVEQGYLMAGEYFRADPGQRGFELFARHVSAPVQSTVTEATALLAKPTRPPQDAVPVVMQLGFADATAVLYLITLSFTRRTPLTPGFLFEAMDPADVVGNCDITFHALRLQDVVYGQYRDAIDAKLQDRRYSLVDTLAEVSSDR